MIKNGRSDRFLLYNNSYRIACVGGEADEISSDQNMYKEFSVKDIISAAQNYYKLKDEKIKPYKKLGELPDYSSKYIVKSSGKKGKK